MPKPLRTDELFAAQDAAGAWGVRRQRKALGEDSAPTASPRRLSNQMQAPSVPQLGLASNPRSRIMPGPINVQAPQTRMPARLDAAPPNPGQRMAGLTGRVPARPMNYEAWKKKYAPNDSGYDYDFRGAFEAGLAPGKGGHWSDRFKRPWHPTFSNESQYATGENARYAGRWDGETFIPPMEPFPASKRPPEPGSQTSQPRPLALGNTPVRVPESLKKAPVAGPIPPEQPMPIPTIEDAIGRAQMMGVEGVGMGKALPPGFDPESPLAEYGSFRFSDEDPSRALSYARMRSPEEEAAYQERMDAQDELAMARQYAAAGLKPPASASTAKPSREYLDPMLQARLDLYRQELEFGDPDAAEASRAGLYSDLGTPLPEPPAGNDEELPPAEPEQDRPGFLERMFGNPGEVETPPQKSRVREDGAEYMRDPDTGQEGWAINGEFIEANAPARDRREIDLPEALKARDAEIFGQDSTPPDQASIAQSFFPDMARAARGAIGSVGEFIGEASANSRLDRQREEALYQQELAKFKAGKRPKRPTRAEIALLNKRLSQ